ncbi:MAG: hypothetical protein SFW07_08360, partial [Gammaproteobacteria bacterium]|nr:hypothetical protein [Gammaproteobacteria bacterium]
QHSVVSDTDEEALPYKANAKPFNRTLAKEIESVETTLVAVEHETTEVSLVSMVQETSEVSLVSMIVDKDDEIVTTITTMEVEEPDQIVTTLTTAEIEYTDQVVTTLTTMEVDTQEVSTVSMIVDKDDEIVTTITTMEVEELDQIVATQPNSAEFRSSYGIVLAKTAGEGASSLDDSFEFTEPQNVAGTPKISDFENTEALNLRAAHNTSFEDTEAQGVRRTDDSDFLDTEAQTLAADHNTSFEDTELQNVATALHNSSFENTEAQLHGQSKFDASFEDTERRGAQLDADDSFVDTENVSPRLPLSPRRTQPTFGLSTARRGLQQPVPEAEKSKDTRKTNTASIR